MQTFLFTLILSLFSASTMSAQTDYETKMSQAFELWQNQEHEEAANLFEQIGTAEKQNWLPFYYASQVKIVQSFPISNVAMKEQLLKDAQRLLNEAKTLKGDEVELMVLQAMLHTATLTIDPSLYGMKLSPVISGIYAEASKKAPNNPRLALSEAEWNMGSARYFGEDPAKYCPDLQAGLQLFAEEKRSPTIAPAWGEDRLRLLIAQTCRE